jgi:hypothetical protein
MPHIFHGERGQHDRLPDVARACGSGLDRDVGDIFMSAEIIRFIPGPRRCRQPTDFPTIAFRSRIPDDLVMDHADTAPSEYSPCHGEEPLVRNDGNASVFRKT